MRLAWRSGQETNHPFPDLYSQVHLSSDTQRTSKGTYSLSQGIRMKSQLGRPTGVTKVHQSRLNDLGLDGIEPRTLESVFCCTLSPRF